LRDGDSEAKRVDLIADDSVSSEDNILRFQPDFSYVSGGVFHFYPEFRVVLVNP